MSWLRNKKISLELLTIIYEPGLNRFLYDIAQFCEQCHGLNLHAVKHALISLSINTGSF